MLYRKVFLITIYLCFSSLAETDNQIKKFEDLFIWKISDELKLTPHEENLVSELIKNTNKKKAMNNADLESLYKKLNEASSEEQRKSTFDKIRAAHKGQLAITLNELDKLR